MPRAEVIGSPISHSRSPSIFSFIAKARGRGDFKYRAHEVRAGELPSWARDSLSDPEWVGANVTIPHKESIRAELGRLSPEALAIGAVNVVRREAQGLTGHNTDHLGISKSLESLGIELGGQSALILGAGGAARAAAYALALAGASRIQVLSPGSERGVLLASDFSRIFPRTEFSAIGRFSDASPAPLALIVNSTPLGMKGVQLSRDGRSPETFYSALTELHYEPGALAFDLIYVPERTPFLATAQSLGLRTLGGLDMLIHQALASWSIWTGDRVDEPKLVSGLRDQLRLEIAASQSRVFLTGFMGSGKSAIGSRLAQELGWRHVDIDSEVENHTGVTIPEIFRQEGEAGFRERERRAIAEIAGLEKVVISLGGGALTHPASFESVMSSGLVIFLEASIETIESRVGSGKRPLLEGLSPEDRRAKIQSLLEVRLPIYRKAHLHANTDSRSPSWTAHSLAGRIREITYREVAK